MKARPSSSRAFAQPTFDVEGPQVSINGKSVDSNSIEPTTPPSTPIEVDLTTIQSADNVPAVLVDSETRRWMSGLKIQRMSDNACDILGCNFNQGLCHYYQPDLKKDLM